MISLDTYSIGGGDYFAQQAEAQFRACFLPHEHQVEVVPDRNKSHRQRVFPDSDPMSRPSTLVAGCLSPDIFEGQHMRRIDV